VSGARRTGSNSARPEVTLLRSAVALTKARGTLEPFNCLLSRALIRFRKAGLTQHDENGGTKSSSPWGVPKIRTLFEAT